MNNQPSNDDLQRAINLMEEALVYMRGLVAPPSTDIRKVVYVEKTISRSGNTTWRAVCDDNEVVYFRMVNQELMEKAGIWERFDGFEYDVGVDVSITIQTIPDGNFHKIVDIHPEWRI